VASCDFSSAGWVCRGGQLIPQELSYSPINSPCPACSTQHFLELAQKRASKTPEDPDCPFCLSLKGLGSMAFKIALEQAIKANEFAARSWLEGQQSMSGQHSAYKYCADEPSV
jgi:hypothetical protein